MNILDFAEKTIESQGKEFTLKELKRLKKGLRENFLYLLTTHPRFLRKGIYKTIKKRLVKGKGLTEEQDKIVEKIVGQCNDPFIKKFNWILNKYQFLKTHIQIYRALLDGFILEPEHWNQIKAVLHGYQDNPDLFRYFDEHKADKESNLIIYDTLVEHKLLEIGNLKIENKSIRDKVIKENNKLGAFYDSRHRNKCSTYHYIKNLMKIEHPLNRDNYRFVNSYLKIVKYDESTVSKKTKAAQLKTRSVNI